MGKNNDSNTTILKKGTVLFKPGSEASKLYILKSGEVRALKISAKHIHLIKTLKPGEVINDVSIIMSTPHSFGAIAHSDVELVTIDAKDIKNAMKECPTWVPDIFKTLCKRLMYSEEMIEEHHLKNSSESIESRVTKEEEVFYLSAFN
jgi:CRP-like cAMP-binding protein